MTLLKLWADEARLSLIKSLGWAFLGILVSANSTRLYPSKQTAEHHFHELSSAAFALDAERFSIMWKLVSDYQNYQEESKKLFINTLLAKGDRKSREKILEALFTDAPYLSNIIWNRTSFFKTYPLFYSFANDEQETITALEIALFTPRLTTTFLEKLFHNSSHFKDKTTVKTILNRIIYEESLLSLRKSYITYSFPTRTPLERKIFWFIHQNPFKKRTAEVFIQNCLKTKSNSKYTQKTIFWKESFLILCLNETANSKAQEIVREQLTQAIEDLENPPLRVFISSTKPAKVYYFIRNLLELYNSFFGSKALLNTTTQALFNSTKSSAHLLMGATRNLDNLTQQEGASHCAGYYFKTPFDLWKICSLFVPQDDYGHQIGELFHQQNWYMFSSSTTRIKMGLQERLNFIKNDYPADLTLKFNN